MNGLMLHCGSSEVSLDALRAVPVPPHTETWRPMAYGDMVDFVKSAITRAVGTEIVSEGYGLNKAGDQMFGLLTLDVGDEEGGLSIGLRSSLNKSLAPAVACGRQVFVCDNLCFSGSAFKVVRKNTKNVWEDFRCLVNAHVGDALGHYEDMKADTEILKAKPCNERRGYAMLGVALGEGIITPNQATVAYSDWKDPRHADFSDRNLWGLYNAVTEGLKKGAPGRILDRHAKAHDWFQGIARA